MPDPAVEDIRIIQGSHWVKPWRLMLNIGTDDAPILVPLDTTGYTARCQIRDDPESSTVLVDCTIGNGRMQVGFDPPKRANSTAYGVGQRIVPITLNGFIYECTVAGTSHSAAPIYPTVIGQTVGDNTVTWVCKMSDATVSNVRLALAPGDSTPLADWGLGYYDVELLDTFGNVLRFIEGKAVLSREITR